MQCHKLAYLFPLEIGQIMRFAFTGFRGICRASQEEIPKRRVDILFI